MSNGQSGYVSASFALRMWKFHMGNQARSHWLALHRYERGDHKTALFYQKRAAIDYRTALYWADRYNVATVIAAKEKQARMRKLQQAIQR